MSRVSLWFLKSLKVQYKLSTFFKKICQMLLPAQYFCFYLIYPFVLSCCLHFEDVKGELCSCQRHRRPFTSITNKILLFGCRYICTPAVRRGQGLGQRPKVCFYNNRFYATRCISSNIFADIPSKIFLG